MKLGEIAREVAYLTMGVMGGFVVTRKVQGNGTVLRADRK